MFTNSIGKAPDGMGAAFKQVDSSGPKPIFSTPGMSLFGGGNQPPRPSLFGSNSKVAANFDPIAAVAGE